jgi:L-serine deaminase
VEAVARIVLSPGCCFASVGVAAIAVVSVAAFTSNSSKKGSDRRPLVVAHDVYTVCIHVTCQLHRPCVEVEGLTVQAVTIALHVLN